MRPPAVTATTLLDQNSIVHKGHNQAQPKPLVCHKHPLTTDTHVPEAIRTVHPSLSD